MLLSYKQGRGGLEAHADIFCDTGSLGQALSIAAGMAASAKNERIAVILGDGEMQEGMIYESLMSIVHHRIKNITLFVDLNGFQSDFRCDETMKIHNEMILTGWLSSGEVEGTM